MGELHRHPSSSNTTYGSHERSVFLTPKIAITGGPCGGKSTYINSIKQNALKTYIVPEAATMIISGGFPMPGDDGRQYSAEWQRALQMAIIGQQKALEYLAEIESTDSEVVILDRGMVDNVSYLKGGVPEYEELAQESISESYERYDTVIHLATLAHHGAYEVESNEARREDPETAIKIDTSLIEAWQGHPNFHIVDQADFTERTAALNGIVELTLRGDK